MGYTHYWYKVEELESTEWQKFIQDFKTILPHFENLLQHDPKGEWDDSLKISNDLVYFNGIGEQAHEPFFFERFDTTKHRQYQDDDSKTHIFSFTKSARKPYDIAVCCALIIAKFHFANDINVSSDGEDEDGWLEARQLTQNVLGYGGEFDINSGGFNIRYNLEASQ